jgi:hypothetical protein
MPIICCDVSPAVRLQPAGPRNIIQRQNPSEFTHEYYLFDAAPHELSSAGSPVRYSRGNRNEPWWLIEKPFVETVPATLAKPQFSSSNNGNNNHRPRRPSPETSQDHWWYSERPFTSAPLPQPTRDTPKPIAKPNQSTVRRSDRERISEISKLNLNTLDSSWYNNN